MTASFHRSFLAYLACLAWLVAGCAGTSHVMLGQVRPPISPDDVQVYSRPPSTRYEEIARIDTSSGGSWSFTSQSKTDAVIRRLKVEAAKLGANGVLLEGIGDRSSGSIGTGGGSESYSRSGSVGGGVGVGFNMTKKVGGGLAIYVDSR
jgi:hypothetical protein